MWISIHAYNHIYIHEHVCIQLVWFPLFFCPDLLLFLLSRFCPPPSCVHLFSPACFLLCAFSHPLATFSPNGVWLNTLFVLPPQTFVIKHGLWKRPTRYFCWPTTRYCCISVKPTIWQSSTSLNQLLCDLPEPFPLDAHEVNTAYTNMPIYTQLRGAWCRRTSLV